MFDFGWQEFVMIAFVLVLVVGPKDLPKVLRAVTKVTGQARQMAREFTNSLEQATADSDMKSVKSMVSDLKSGNLEDMARIIDDQDVKAELGKIKENVDVASISHDVKDIQKAGRKATAPKPSQDKS